MKTLSPRVRLKELSKRVHDVEADDFRMLDCSWRLQDCEQLLEDGDITAFTACADQLEQLLSDGAGGCT